MTHHYLKISVHAFLAACGLLTNFKEALFDFKRKIYVENTHFFSKTGNFSKLYTRLAFDVTQKSRFL